MRFRVPCLPAVLAGVALLLAASHMPVGLPASLGSKADLPAAAGAVDTVRWAWARSVGRAAAPPPTWVLTVVTLDGAIWAHSDGRAPVRVRAASEGEAAVIALAWHPGRPELLLVRQRRGRQGPLDSLVRVDLATGSERELLADVGPQGRISRPQYGPDGSWAVAAIGCCLGQELVVLDDLASPPRSADLARFAEGLRGAEVYPRFVQVVADGRLLVGAVDYGSVDPPARDVTGLYLVTRDLSQAEPLVLGLNADRLGILGVGPDLAWVAAVRFGEWNEVVRRDATLLKVDVDGGVERTLGSLGAPYAIVGSVAPDGRIAVTDARLETDGVPEFRLSNLRLIDPSSAEPTLAATETEFAAFAWAPMEVLRGIGVVLP